MNFFSNILGGGPGQGLNYNRPGRLSGLPLYEDSMNCFPAVFADRHDLEDGNKSTSPY